MKEEEELGRSSNVLSAVIVVVVIIFVVGFGLGRGPVWGLGDLGGRLGGEGFAAVYDPSVTFSLACFASFPPAQQSQSRVVTYTL